MSDAPGAAAGPRPGPSVRALRALALPDARSDFPFGPDAEAFRIHGRIFALLTSSPRVSTEHAFVNLKVEPVLVDGLVGVDEVGRRHPPQSREPVGGSPSKRSRTAVAA